MQKIQLIGNAADFRSQKVKLTADILNLPIELQQQPNVGVKIVVNGVQVFGANAAMRTLASLQPSYDICGQGFAQKAHVEQWVDWCALELEPFLELLLDALERKSESVDEIELELAEKLKFLERNLQNQYIVGNQITLADVALASALWQSLQSSTMVGKFSAIVSYVQFVGKSRSVQRVLGSLLTLSGESKSSDGQGSPSKQIKRVADLKKFLSDQNLKPRDLKTKLLGFQLYCCKYRFTEYNVIASISSNKMKKFVDNLRKKGSIGGSFSVNGQSRPFEITGAIICETSLDASLLSEVKDSGFYDFEKVTQHTWDKFYGYLKGSICDEKEVRERLNLGF